jgi:hypothetical protein
MGVIELPTDFGTIRKIVPQPGIKNLLFEFTVIAIPLGLR